MYWHYNYLEIRTSWNQMYVSEGHRKQNRYLQKWHGVIIDMDYRRDRSSLLTQHVGRHDLPN